MASKILTNSVLIPMGVPICVENLIAIVILFRCSKMLVQIRILSINLSITDFLGGLVLCVPDDIAINCTYKKYLASPFIIVSLLTITMFNIDRCCAIRFAISYYKIMTTRLLLILCVMCWFIAVLLTYFIFYDAESPYGIYCGVMYLAPRLPVNMVAKWSCIFILIANILMNGYLMSYLFTSPNMGKRDYKPNKDLNGIVGKLSMITGFFCICYSPYCLIQVIPEINTSAAFGFIHAVALGVLLLNSIINPVLYVWRFREARFQLKMLMCFWDKIQREKIENQRNRFFATYTISIIQNVKARLDRS